jgi:small subunit ribosomal protein S17
MKKEILGVKAPKNKCTDNKCPFHGLINVKNEPLKGTVVKKDISRSATIEWSKSHYVSKYERYELRRSRQRVHNPTCLNAEIGDEVLAVKTRPLSKTKNYVIIDIIKRESASTEPVEEKKASKAKTEKKQVKKEEKAGPVESVKKTEKVEESEN